MARANVSLEPPGALPTTSVMGLAGPAGAWAQPARGRAQAKPSAARSARVFMRVSCVLSRASLDADVGLANQRTPFGMLGADVGRELLRRPGRGLAAFLRKL